MNKNTLGLNVPSHTKMGQLIVAKNIKSENIRQWPFDYITYQYFRTDGGFIVYQEMYDEGKNKQLNKMFIPEIMVDDFSVFIAGELLEH